nr:MAG TPA: hypothetical protein [Caudoviricetes sp.]
MRGKAKKNPRPVSRNKGKISHFLDGFSLDLVKCLAGEGEKEPPACK